MADLRRKHLEFEGSSESKRNLQRSNFMINKWKLTCSISGLHTVLAIWWQSSTRNCFLDMALLSGCSMTKAYFWSVDSSPWLPNRHTRTNPLWMAKGTIRHQDYAATIAAVFLSYLHCLLGRSLFSLGTMRKSRDVYATFDHSSLIKDL